GGRGQRHGLRPRQGVLGFGFEVFVRFVLLVFVQRQHSAHVFGRRRVLGHEERFGRFLRGTQERERDGRYLQGRRRRRCGVPGGQHPRRLLRGRRGFGAQHGEGRPVRQRRCEDEEGLRLHARRQDRPEGGAQELEGGRLR